MRTLRFLGAAVVGVAAGMQVVAAAHADTRVALVIGNSAYENVAQLTNPTNDANLIAAALKQDGFGVTLADNLDHDGLIRVLQTFGNEADSADWAVIYYAGHGIEMAGVNYLVPVDAKLATDRDVGFEAVPIDQVMSAIDGARSLRMVILDACRNDPFLQTMKRSTGAGRDIGRGLARVEPAQATLVAYSAKAGTIAADGDGADSPFAIALAQHLTEPGVEVDKLFRLVRDDVLAATRKKQEPFVYGSLPGQDFYFQPSTAAAAAAATPALPAAGNDPTATDYQATAAVGTAAAWDLFLKKHGGDPDNFYVGLAKEARQKLAALTPSAGEPAEMHFHYQSPAGPYVRRATGAVKDTRGLVNALASLQPPPGAHGGYGLIGDDDLLGKEPGYGLRQLGSVARQYVTFDSLYVEQPPGFDQIGVQSGKFTKVDQLNDTTLGWVFFDLRAQFEADLKKHDS